MILLVLLACGGDASTPVAPALPVAASKTTFGTLRELGSWQLVAEARRSTNGATPSVERYEVKWKDDDTWSWVLSRDGVVRTDVLVWRSIAWARDARGERERKGDAEGWRVQLASVWDPWAWAFESLADQLELTAGPVELLDGRRAVRYAVSSRPPSGKKGWQVSAARGDVWIDEATAVRLRGDVTVEAANGATRTVQLVFSLDGIGLDPDISAPRRDRP